MKKICARSGRYLRIRVDSGEPCRRSCQFLATRALEADTD